MARMFCFLIYSTLYAHFKHISEIRTEIWSVFAFFSDTFPFALCLLLSSSYCWQMYQTMNIFCQNCWYRDQHSCIFVTCLVRQMSQKSNCWKSNGSVSLLSVQTVQYVLVSHGSHSSGHTSQSWLKSCFRDNRKDFLCFTSLVFLPVIIFSWMADLHCACQKNWPGSVSSYCYHQLNLLACCGILLTLGELATLIVEPYDLTALFQASAYLLSALWQLSTSPKRLQKNCNHQDLLPVFTQILGTAISFWL